MKIELFPQTQPSSTPVSQPDKQDNKNLFGAVYQTVAQLLAGAESSMKLGAQSEAQKTTSVQSVQAVEDVVRQDQLALSAEALSLLAEIHILLGKNNAQAAIAKANELMSRCAGKCDSTINNLIAFMQPSFTITNGKVTQVNTSTFNNLWTNVAGNGVYQAISWLTIQSKGGALSETAPSSDYPLLFPHIMTFIADAMTVTTFNDAYDIDASFWGFTAGFSYDVATQFAYACAVGYYQQIFNDPNGSKDWNELNQKMNNLFNLLPNPSQVSGPNANYTRAYNNFALIKNSFVNEHMMPPSSWPPALINTIFDPSDLSTYFGSIQDETWDAVFKDWYERVKY